jgi:hypothetical protein
MPLLSLAYEGQQNIRIITRLGALLNRAQAYRERRRYSESIISPQSSQRAVQVYSQAKACGC